MEINIETGDYITILTAILGIAYPIITEIISKILGRYNSVHITELFEKEALLKKTFLFKYE